MKRRDFFKAAGIGAISTIALVGCTTQTEKKPDPCSTRPKTKTKSKLKHKPYSRISLYDMADVVAEVHDSYADALVRVGGDLTPNTTTFKSNLHDNILVRMDISDHTNIMIYDIIDLNKLS